MRTIAIRMIVWLILCLPLTLFAGIEDHKFTDSAQEALYVQLTKELRCLVCQNQNLADSNADLAKDLREKTYQMVIEGKSREQITEYMITRYGDFVLYRPPVKNSTYLLWLGPFAFLLIALWALFSFLRKRSANIGTPSTAELEQAKHHLHDHTD